RIARHKRDRISDPLVSNRASRQIYESSPVLTSQQQGISLEDMQKAIQNALAQQKTEYQSLLEKQKSDFQSQMAQQVSTPQTVEPVRQPRGPSSSLKTEEGLKNYYVAEYLKEVGLLNNSARIDRLEEGIDETHDAVNQLTNQFKKLSIRKCDICGETGHSKGSCPKQIARFNFNRSYFKPLIPIVPPDSDGKKNDGNGYDKT